MLRVNLMIGDRELSAADGRTFERVDPLTGEVATEAAAATITDAIAAADAAARAFPAWSATGPGRAPRHAECRRRSDRRTRAEDFAEAMIAEIGATPAWCEFNVKLAASMLREAAALTTQITGEVIPSDEPGRVSMAVRQPAGVVLGIAPWNAPVILGVRAIAMPLACGNTVILKASELCPATHRLIGTALRDAGLPHGVVNVVTQRAGGCRQGGRGADLAPGRAARSASPARRASAGWWRKLRRATSSRSCSSSAARRRWSCSTTPISMRR